MNVNSGSMVNQGLVGMQRSQAEMLRSAEQISRAATAPANEPAGPMQGEVVQAGAMQIVEPLLNIKAQQQVFDSSARVVQAADENIGRLLDTSA